jgi:DNA-binding IclR family transcriptional regulator
MSEKLRSGVQVIARAATVLRVLQVTESGMSLAKIAEKVGLPRSTVQRIVGALISERFVMSDSKGGNFRLGPGIKALASAVQYDVSKEVRPHLVNLGEITGETADLSLLRGHEMIFLDQVAGNGRLRAVSFVGEVFPLTNTANGKACLAELAEDKARQLIELEFGTTGQDGDVGQLMEELKTIRNTGLAYDEDLHTVGISALGFAFKDPINNLHAISVPIPSSRFAEKRAAVEVALLRAKKNVISQFAQK